MKKSNFKVCSTCKILKSIDEFKTPGSVDCPKCTSLNYYYRNKEKVAQRNAIKYANRTEEERLYSNALQYAWRKNNPDKMKEANRKKYAHVKANPELYKKQLESSKLLHAERKYNKCNQDYRDRSKKNLTDNYIKRILLSHVVKLSYSDIPVELVELKRKELLLLKTIKNKENV